MGLVMVGLGLVVATGAVSARAGMHVALGVALRVAVVVASTRLMVRRACVGMPATGCAMGAARPTMLTATGSTMLIAA